MTKEDNSFIKKTKKNKKTKQGTIAPFNPALFSKWFHNINFDRQLDSFSFIKHFNLLIAFIKIPEQIKMIRKICIYHNLAVTPTLHVGGMK